jgi:hypothetical protein
MRNRAGLGLLAILMFACVFGIEAILSVMRVRKLSVTVDVQDAQGVVLNATAEATDAAGVSKTPTPQGNIALEPLILPVDGTLVVNARWDYRIGPTFPQTIFRAQVTDANRKIVAANGYKLNCGSNSMECRGTAPLTLNFGVINSDGTRENWPAGEYQLRVTQSTGDLKIFDLLTQPIIVSDAQ